MNKTKEYGREMNIPDDIIRLMFVMSSAEMKYLSLSDIKRLSTTQPYYDEYWRAKCGYAPDNTRLGHAYGNPGQVQSKSIIARHENYVACIGALRRQVFEAKAAEYLRMEW